MRTLTEDAGNLFSSFRSVLLNCIDRSSDVCHDIWPVVFAIDIISRSFHYSGVIMSAMVSQINGVFVVC